jgi:VCBS repeat protein
MPTLVFYRTSNPAGRIMQSMWATRFNSRRTAGRNLRARLAPLALAGALVLAPVASAQASFGPEQRIDASVDTMDFELVDLDGDGDLDVLAGELSIVHTLVWHENTGLLGSFVQHKIIEVSIHHARSADLDGDGHLDIMDARLRGTTGAVWFESDGGTPPRFGPLQMILEGAAEAVQPVDIDGDNDVDLFVAEASEDYTRIEVSWLENDGNTTPTFTQHLLSEQPIHGPTYPDTNTAEWPYWRVADIDADGDPDPVLQLAIDGQAGRTFVWFDNNAATHPILEAKTLTQSTQAQPTR